MEDITVKKLELTIIATIARSPGEYKSQYDIYNEIIEDLDIKTTEDKEKLKINFLYILRVLPNLYDEIKIVKKNEILYIAYSPNKEDFDILNKNIDQNIDKNDKNKMPLEIDVINFILDESTNDNNLLKYFNKKDYNNNTILHSLIINNDYERIKKSFNKLYSMTDKKNNDDKTPIELINDIKISNLFLLDLIKTNKNLEYDIILLEDKNNIEKQNNLFYFKLLFYINLMFLFCLIILSYINLIF